MGVLNKIMISNNKLIILMFFMCGTLPAYAYIDPGSGSLLLQILVAFIIGLLFKLKIFFNVIRDKIKSILKR